MLAAELELDRIVQAVTDAGTELCGAQFGAFFYNVRDERGESYQLFALTGAPRKAFERFGMPRNTAVFAPTFRGEGPVRLADVTQDPRYGQNAPHHGMPAGHLPVRSYLAVPVVSRSGEVHGGLFFGHAQPGVFTARSERLLVGVAAQAAIAIDNAGLYDRSRRLVAELRDVDRRKDEFLAILSHELRNPLAPIRNAVALLELGDADPALRQQARAVLDRQVRHLVRLVDDLLDVSRISRGVIELKQDPLLLGELVASAVETSRPIVERHGHELRLDLPPAPVALHGDAVRLAQALANLLNNAALYTPPGGRIDLAARLADGSVVIDVRDNGIGIAAETLPYLFDMFRRGAYGQQNPTGFGVGLALARRLVEMHGGSLTAASEGPGKGAVFTLRLPAAGD
jgi:signal transduction histidine kinase